MSKIYAGIGSREIPKEVENLFVGLGKYFGKLGYTLRSGAADGSDMAFEKGCDLVGGKKEIFIPWKGFNESDSNLYNITEESMQMAAKFHPGWQYLKQGARKLMARNCMQLLGFDLKTPVDFVLCYTKNGSGSGGTGQGIRIAKEYNIPIMDFGVIFRS